MPWACYPHPEVVLIGVPADFARRSDFNEAEAAAARERAVGEREHVVAKREAAVGTREAAVAAREASLALKASAYHG